MVQIYHLELLFYDKNKHILCHNAIPDKLLSENKKLFYMQTYLELVMLTLPVDRNSVFPYRPVHFNTVATSHMFLFKFNLN